MEKSASPSIYSLRCLIPAGAAVFALCLVLSACGTPQQKEARYLESGKRMVARKDYPRAIIQFNNAAKVMPKDAEPYYQLALAYLDSRQYQPAYASLRKAVELDPKHREAQLKLAELMATSKEPKTLEQAQETIQNLLETAPPTAEALDALATTEIKLNNLEDAEKHLEEAVSEFPKDLRAAVYLSTLKRSRNDLAGAEEVLKKAAGQSPSSANAFIALGAFYAATGRPADAEAQFRHATTIDPQSGLALMYLAVLQSRTGKLDQADQTYARLSALPEPSYRPYHAAFLAARGKHDQATQEFQRLNQQNPDDRAVRSYLVRELMLAGKSADAENLVDAALKKNPKDTDALLSRSTIYLVNGKADAAQQDLLQVLHFHADSAQAHFLLAKVHQMRGDSLNQRNELNEALRIRPGFLQARVQLAQALLASGAAQSALDLLNAREVPQNNLGVIAQKNWTLLALKQNDEARQEVARGLAAARAPELLLQDAYLKIQQKEYSAARASLAEALNRSPENLRILRLMAASYEAEKQPDTAVRMVREYAARHPKSAPVQEFLAELLMVRGQRQEARQVLFAVVKDNPGFTPARISLAQLDMAEGHASDAIKALSEVLDRNPKNVIARMLLAGIQDSGGNHTAAVDAYKKVLDVQPANVVALNNVAYDLAEYANRPDEALQYAQKAAELQPDAPAVENTLGWVLYRKGLYSTALPYLEKAAEKEPSARRKCHVAMAYLRMGDQEKGQKNLEAALKLDPNVPEIHAAQQILDEMRASR